MPALTASNLIDDLVRAAGVQGDGRAPDGSLGIWPATTNLITNGGFETDLNHWDFINGAVLTPDPTRFKFGTRSMKIVTPGGTSDEGPRFNLGIAIAPGNTYTFSIWIIGPAGALIKPQINWYLGAAFVSGQIGTGVTLTGNLQRLILTGTAPVGADTAYPFVLTLGAQAITFNLDGAQFELGAIATPYVHTDGATATRAGGTISAPTSLLDVTQGWVAALARPGVASTVDTRGRIAAIGDSVSGNRVEMQLFTGGPIIARVSKVTGALGTADAPLAGWAAGDVIPLVYGWSATDLRVSANRAPFVVTAFNPPTLPAPNVLNFGMSSIVPNRELAGDLLWVATGLGALRAGDDVLLASLAGSSYQDTAARLEARHALTSVITGDSAYYFPDPVTPPPRFAPRALGWPYRRRRRY